MGLGGLSFIGALVTGNMAHKKETPLTGRLVEPEPSSTTDIPAGTSTSEVLHVERYQKTVTTGEKSL